MTALAHLQRRTGSFWSSLARMPAVAFISFFHQSFIHAERNVSRSRERTADQVGAKLAGPAALGTALVKVHSHVRAWKPVFEGLRSNDDEFKSEANAVTAFVERAKRIPSEELEWANSRQVAHPTDSHPTLSERLVSLGLKFPDLVRQVAVPSVEDSGSGLIDNAEDLERRLTQALRAKRR